MFLGFSGGSVVKNPPANAGDAGNYIPGLGQSPEEGNGNPLQYSCLESPMDRGAWQVTYSPWDCKESDMTEQQTLSHFYLTCLPCPSFQVDFLEV